MSNAATLNIAVNVDSVSAVAGLNEIGHTLGKSFMPALVTSELIADGIKEVAGRMWDFAMSSVSALAEVERISGQTAAVLTSTGGAAGVSMENVIGLADSIERLTGIEAETIQTGENLLLTFTNIKNEAGAGNDIFNQTTGIMADLSTAMGGDVKGAALQLGKALNDPTAGMTALTRVGVTFTESQKEQVTALMAAGKRMEAQKIILAELNKEFGGSAMAFGQTLPGQIAKFNNALGNVGEAIMGNFMPAIKNGVDVATDAFVALGDAIADKGLIEGVASLFGPETRALILGIGTAISVAVIPRLLAMAPTAAVAAASMASSAAAAVVAWAPFLALAGAIAFAATPIIKYWDDIAFELGRVFDFVSGKVTEFVNWVKTGFQHVANNIVGPVVKFITEKLSALWGALPTQAQDALKAVGAGFTNLAQPVGGTVSLMGLAASATGGAMKFIGANMAESFSGWGDMFKGGMDLVSKFTQAVPVDLSKLAGGVKNHMGNAAGAVNGLGKAAKGTSAEMKKHAEAMAKAAAKAAKEMQEAFERGQDALREFSSTISVFTNLKADLRDLQVEADLFGDGFVEAGQAADKVKGAMKDLLDKGMSPTAPMIKQLHQLWGQYNEASKEVVEETTDVEKIMGKLSDELIAADTKAKRLGESFDLNAEQAKLYNIALGDLAGIGGAQAQQAFEGVGQALAEIPPAQMSATTAMGAFKQSTTDILSAVTGLREGLKTVAEALGVEIGEGFLDATVKAGNFGLALVQVATSAQSLYAFVVPAFEAIGTAVGVVGTAATATGLAIAGVVAGTVAAVAGFFAFSKAIIDSLGGAQQAWEVFVSLMSITGAALVEGLKMIAVGIADGILGTIKGMVNAVISGLNFFIRALNSIGFSVPDWIPGLGGKHWSPNVAQIPFLADGGLISSPTLAMVGEGTSPEAVVPLNAGVFSQLGAGIASHMPAYAGSGGGDTYIELHFRVDDQEAGERLVKTLRSLGLKF